MNIIVDLGDHTLPCAQRTPPDPQREVTLQLFSADLVTHPLRNPLLKGNFYSLDTVQEGLLHCMLQTHVVQKRTKHTNAKDPPMFCVSMRGR